MISDFAWLNLKLPGSHTMETHSSCTWKASWSFFWSIKAICRSKHTKSSSVNISNAQLKTIQFFVIPSHLWGPARRGPSLHPRPPWKPAAASFCENSFLISFFAHKELLRLQKINSFQLSIFYKIFNNINSTERLWLGLRVIFVPESNQHTFFRTCEVKTSGCSVTWAATRMSVCLVCVRCVGDRKDQTVYPDTNTSTHTHTHTSSAVICYHNTHT